MSLGEDDDAARSSAPLFSNNQRKRPVLSNLGKESFSSSDEKQSPITPCPLPSEDPSSLNDSEVFINIKQPIHHPNWLASGPNSALSKSPRPKLSLKEPSLASILDHLASFQTHYDQKTDRIKDLVVYCIKNLSLMHYRNLV